MDFFYTSQHRFTAFSLEHLGVLFFYVIISILFYSVANRYLKESGQRTLGMVLACIPLLGLLSRMFVEHRMGEFTYLEDLPLFICRLVCFILPILFWSGNKRLFGTMYFWVMAGTTNALITPDIKFGLPHYESIFSWIIHAGLVMSILYGVFVFKWKPEKQDIWRAFWWANLFLVFVHGINCLLEANYSYTMHKPPNGSLLDFFGPWPIYLMTGQFIALVLFALFYLPFFFKQEKQKDDSFLNQKI